MDASAVENGVRVRIKAADEFYAYIDGWSGVIASPCWRSGYVIVHCQMDGTTLEFLVPVEQLELVQ